MCSAAVAGLAILYGLAWLLAQALGDRETLYQSKPVDYWIEQVNNGDATASNRAAVVVNSEIVPQLTNSIFCDTNDSPVKFALVEALNNLPGILIHCAPADIRRGSAVSELGELGPVASRAGPALLQALAGNDGAVKGVAAVTLGKIRFRPDQVIPLLTALLDDPFLKAEAAEGLGGFGALSKGAVPKLSALLKVPEKEVRHAAREALDKIGAVTTAETGGK
jgi:HEAT repeat protein